jgi:hypothetical protein
MTDRFDLEQGILKCWNITDDIDLLYRNLMNSSDMSTDDIANFLLGIKTVYDLKFNELFSTFEVLIENKKIT